MTGGMKEAGHSWLPRVPEHWSIAPANALFAVRNEPSRPEDEHLTPSQKYGVLPQREYMEITGNRVVQNLTGSDNMKHVEPGDVISHLRSFQGGLETSSLSGKVSQAYTVIRPRRSLTRSYYSYLFKSNRYVQALRVTTNQLRDGQSIRFAELRQIPLPVPPLDEQQAISDYLDRETAQIDELIEKQTTLIDRLQERRRALHSHILGNPEWPMVPLRYLCHTIVDCPHWTPNVVEESEYEAVRSGCIRDGRYRPEAALPVDHETYLARNRGVTPTEGDVLFAREAPAGEACLVPRGRRLCLGQRTVLLKVNRDRIRPEMVLANIYSRRVQDRFSVETQGSTVGNLRLPVIRSTGMVVPPRELQDDLVERFGQQLDEIDELIEKTERFIELTRERRSALITEAATGQIDVTKKEPS